MRIAAWSGPRNLSTAMMYSFGARLDFAVWDEPFYAAYLLSSGVKHPMRDEIIKSQHTDPLMISHMCSGSIPAKKPNFYMKHMAHHMLPDFPLDWATSCTNLHLIRHPARVIASYLAKVPTVTLDDIGVRQQFDIFEKFGGVVVDSTDIRGNPSATLGRLCAAIGLDFDPAMLSWPKGGHPDDGVWAAHWYNAVHNSTSFQVAEGELPTLIGQAAEVLEEALPYYQRMLDKAL